MNVKTFENLRCYGFAVQTANTIQTDKEFVSCHWIDESIIKNQLEVLLKRFQIDFVKVGIVESWELLLNCIKLLKKYNPKVKIIVDPVLRSSTEFEFHGTAESVLDDILKQIYLLTPNYQEIERLYSHKSIEETIQHISSRTNVFLKGGHRKDKIFYLQKKERNS